MGTAADLFGPVVTAMVTAFDGEGGLDIDKTVSIARFLQSQGNTALVLTGTTGEASTLTDEEKIAIWEAVASAVTIPVIAGSGSNDTAHSVHMTASAERVGVAGILAVAPYYNRPAQSGIAGHFRAVAGATKLPVVLYDIPVRTGRKVAADTIIGLADELDNLVALKDAAGSPAATAELLGRAKAGFDVYSGDDSLTLPLLSVGAVGVIGVATHWATPFFAAMLETFFAGNVARAAEINRALVPSYIFETSEAAPNPVPTKAMMEQLGYAAGDCRLPLGKGPDWLADKAGVVLSGLADAASELNIKAVS
ncbi:MAG: 4-hydroxy-tetrahydrodipicolinate synthase [Actinomycetota bacterium]|nr:4-hydroxy-tetrahydrodipicolinate synthase [Actinomycetota bacterium]